MLVEVLGHERAAPDVGPREVGGQVVGLDVRVRQRRGVLQIEQPTTNKYHMVGGGVSSVKCKVSTVRTHSIFRHVLKRQARVSIGWCPVQILAGIAISCHSPERVFQPLDILPC